MYVGYYVGLLVVFLGGVIGLEEIFWVEDVGVVD